MKRWRMKIWFKHKKEVLSASKKKGLALAACSTICSSFPFWDKQMECLNPLAHLKMLLINISLIMKVLRKHSKRLWKRDSSQDGCGLEFTLMDRTSSSYARRTTKTTQWWLKSLLLNRLFLLLVWTFMNTPIGKSMMVFSLRPISMASLPTLIGKR